MTNTFFLVGEARVVEESSVMKEKRLFVLGTENELARLASK